jgi:hypothetical protein
MTALDESQFVLLEFYGVEPRYLTTVLAERLPKPQVHVWDVLTERVLSADSLATFASELVAANPVSAGSVVLIGSCFSAPLVTACSTALHQAGPVVALSIDPIVIGDEVLRAQVAALAARVGTTLTDLDVAATDWVERVVMKLRHNAVRRTIDDGDSLGEAEEAADNLVRHYRLWLHYLRLCCWDQASTRVVRAVFSEAGRAGRGEVGDVLRLGSFADTADVLASDELVDWVMRASVADRSVG